MKNKIRIYFTDFWSHFDKNNNYFTQLLSKHFDIEITENPDYLIYSCYGDEHLNYLCYRIYYNGENLRINWNACDYAFSFDYIDDERHFRLPNWIWYYDPRLLLEPKQNAVKLLSTKTGFCNMVVSNPHSLKRIDFFHKLSKYKKVDSGGKYLNNIGGPVNDKISFIRQYKFTIAFENSSHSGYTTEKLLDSMLGESIPIYYGNPDVKRDFNTQSFINYDDFSNEDNLIDYIIKLDNDDELYANIWNHYWYKNNQLPSCVKEENIVAMFQRIFSNSEQKKPVAISYKRIKYKIDILINKFDHILNSKLKYRKNFR